jgi:hypothetical protein
MTKTIGRAAAPFRISSFLIVCFCFGFRDIRRPDVDPD